MHTSAQYLAADDKRTKVLATIADYLPESAMMSIIFREARIDRHRALVTVASRKYEETGKADVVPACSDVDPSIHSCCGCTGLLHGQKAGQYETQRAAFNHFALADV